MGLKRLDNVGIVVEDLDRAVEFFVELGLTQEARMRIDGDWAARVVGLPGQICDIAMLRGPDGSGLELMMYERPQVIRPTPDDAPPNTLGFRRLMFAVDDLDDTLKRLTARGATLVGEVAQYETTYRLCYLRGPEGLLIALAQKF